MESSGWILVRIISLDNAPKAVINLSKDKTYTCGRAKNNDISCKSNIISRNHCIFLQELKRIFVQDLESVNGLFINGKIQTPLKLVELKEADVIGIGTNDQNTDNPTKYIFRLQKEIVTKFQREVFSSLPKERNLNCKIEDYASDNNVQILEEFSKTVKSEIETETTDYEIIKINFEFDIPGINEPKLYVNSDPSSANISDLVTIVIPSNHRDVLEIENQSRVCSREIEIIEGYESQNQENNLKIIKTELCDSEFIHDEIQTAPTIVSERHSLNDLEGSKAIKDILQYQSRETNSIGIPIENIQKVDPVVKEIEPSKNQSKNTLSIKSPEIEKQGIKILNPMEIDKKYGIEDATRVSSQHEKSNERENISRSGKGEEIKDQGMEMSEPMEIQDELVVSDKKEKMCENRIISRDNAVICNSLSHINSVGLNDEVLKNHKESTDDFNFSLNEDDLTSNSFSTSSEVNNCKTVDKNSLDEGPSRKKRRIMTGLMDDEFDKSSYTENNEDLLTDDVTTSVEKTDFNLQEFPMILKNYLTAKRKKCTSVPNNMIYQCKANKPDEVLMEILSWKPEEFLIKEYFNCNQCCYNYKKLLKKSANTYKDYAHYRSALITYLMLEVSCGIKKDFSTLEKNPLFTECVLEHDTAIKFQIGNTNSFLMGFQIQIICSETRLSEVPKVGDLISLEIIRENNDCSTIFAYVGEVSILREENKSFVRKSHNLRLPVICSMITNLLDFNVCESRIKSLHVLIGVLVALNLVKALEEFENSPLLPFILHPKAGPFHSWQSLSESDILRSLRFLALQKNQDYHQVIAVLKIAKAIESEEPQVCLIEGSPGTGKTNVAMNILLRILCMEDDSDKRKQPLRILVCAESKSEIDEILLRFSVEEKRLGMSHSIVRIGSSKNIHERVKNFSLQTLAENYIKEKNEVSEINPADYSKRLDSVKKLLLVNANVIFCTTSMCLSDHMTSVFGKEHPISVCIVDEAAQVNEIDVLKPLSFGVKTLILLGDKHKRSLINLSLSEKFPSTDSATDKLKSCNSLFLRTIRNFNQTEVSPVINLQIQYRMNKIVMSLINECFYNRILENKVQGQQECHLFSCSVFSFDSTNSHLDEALFAANLIFCILSYMKLDNFKKPIGIGIVVSHKISKKCVKLAIDKWTSGISLKKKEFFKIDVNTISEFKNQERDVLIISCVNKNKDLLLPRGEEWLYSAMSKAKRSLIMFGVNSTFEQCKKLCLWNSLIEHVKDQKNFIEIKNLADPVELRKLLLRE